MSAANLVQILTAVHVILHVQRAIATALTGNKYGGLRDEVGAAEIR
jgi:hypothetical protein